MTADILMMGAMPTIEAKLASRFRLHRFPTGEDAPPLSAESFRSIRGIVAYSSAQPVDAGVLGRVPNVEIIANMGAGYESIDIGAVKARGIIVTNASGLNAVDVAEHAIGMLLAVARDIVAADRYARAGLWKTEGRMPLGRRLAGRKLGILGLGHIGLAIARRARAFDLRISYHNRRPVADAPYEYVATIEELARRVDILAVAAPGGSETRHLVDRTVLDALGPAGILINVGRGSIVDQSALIDALADGRLGGAGLDVFEDEPNIPDRLMALPNVVLQPHIAGATREAVAAAIDSVVDNLVAHFAGLPVSHRVA